MGIKQYKPTSAGRRAGMVSDFADCTHPRSNRPEKALEEQYEAQGIKVRDVNTVSMRGKKRRSSRRLGAIGHTADWKKAIVTLGEGQKIEGLFGSA